MNLKAKSNLGIFTSSFQVINFFELLIKNRLSDKSTLIYIVNSNITDADQLKRIKIIKDFYRFYPKVFLIKKNIFFIQFFIFLKIIITKYNLIAIGRFFSPKIFTFLFFRAKAKYIVDDGMEVLDIPKKLKMNSKFNYFFFIFFRKELIKTKFFTIFKKKFFFKSEKNNFTYLKKKISKKIFSKEIWFIDQTAFSDIFFDIKSYLLLIKKIKKKFSRYKFMLILHPTDSNKKKQFLLKKSRINFIKIHQPLELYFSTQKVLPAKIISFNSTCLLTLSILLKEVKKLKILFVPIDRKYYKTLQYYKINKKYYDYLGKQTNISKVLI